MSRFWRTGRFEYNDPPDPQPMYPEVADFLQTSEVTAGHFIVNPMFQYKFRQEAPRFGYHLVTFYKDSDGALRVANYLHARPYGSVILLGGASTDGRVVNAMTAGEREAVMALGGVYYIALTTVFDLLKDRCEAFFGYAGDARSLEVSIPGGFSRVERQEFLLSRFQHADTSERRKRQLIAEVAKLGPF